MTRVTIEEIAPLIGDTYLIDKITGLRRSGEDEFRLYPIIKSV